MPDIIEGPPGDDEALPPLRRRLLWFALLALGGTLSTATIAYALRALLKL